MDPKKDHLTTAFDARNQQPSGQDNAPQKADPYLGMMGYPYNVQSTSPHQKKF